MLEEQLFARDRALALRIPDHEIGVITGCDAPLVTAEPCEARRVGTQPAGQLHEACAALLRLGPDGAEPELQRCDAPPGLVKVAALLLLELRRARTVIGDDEIDHTFEQ